MTELLQDGATIGIGWGSTTHELVSELAPVPCRGGRVVQITGGNKALPNQFDCHEVTRRLAKKLGVAPVLLHAPGIVARGSAWRCARPCRTPTWRPPWAYRPAASTC